MHKAIKICLSIAILGAIIGGAVWLGLNKNSPAQSFRIVATNFAGYDFARTVTDGIDGVTVEMLLPPGADLHAFEPTPSDITKIAEANLFIYNGGESEKWVEEILKSSHPGETVKMMDLASVVTEEAPKGQEEMPHDDGTESHAVHGEHKTQEEYGASETHKGHEAGEYDEHVWTSFENAAKITAGISEKVANMKPELKEKTKKNLAEFTAQADALKTKYQDLIANAKRRVVVFGDKFPLRYFVDEMGLEYYAAFPGCAEETEASPKTIANLTKVVQDQQIPVVFKIELSSGNIAETIAGETGAKILEFNTIHNISRADFEGGASFLKIMEQNLPLLEEALN